MHRRTASCMHGSMKELDAQQKMAMYTVITHAKQRLLLLHMTSIFMVIQLFQEQLQGSQRCGLHKCVCIAVSIVRPLLRNEKGRILFLVEGLKAIKRCCFVVNGIDQAINCDH